MKKIKKIQEFNRNNIGEPANLSKLLLALANKSPDGLTLAGNYRDGYLDFSVDIDNFDGSTDWDLTKETLEEQSEECQRAVYELLGGK